MFGILAALGAAGGQGFTAYQGQLDRQQELEQRRQLHAITMEEAAQRRAVAERAEAERVALAAAAAPVVPTSGEVYQPAVDDGGEPMLPNPTAGMQRVGNGPLMTPEAAAAAVAPLNTMPARARRQGEALAGMGKLGQARQLAEAADMMEKEGHLDFIDANLAKMPTPEQIAAGQTTFQLAGIEKFNSTGTARIPDGAIGRAMLRTLPSGQQVTDFEVVDPGTGEPIAPSARQYEQAYGMTRGERRSAERQQFSDKLSAEDRSERRGILHLEQQDRAADRKDRAADRAADNARLDRQLEGQLGYWNSMAGAANTRAEKTGAGGRAGSMIERMPEADRRIYENAVEERNTIHKKIVEAKANGDWRPDKVASQKELQADLTAASLVVSTMEQKFGGAGSAVAAADPLGLRAKAAPGAGGAPAVAGAETVPNPFGGGAAPAAPRAAAPGRAGMMVTAAEQRARDADGGAMRLRTEYGGDLNRARSDLQQLDAAAGRATGEARTIMRAEADRLRAALAGAERTVAAPAAPLESRTVPAKPPAPAGQGQPTPQDAVERVGAALDAARAAAQAARDNLARYGLMQRRADPQGFAAAQAAAAAAEQARERAEQDYRAAASAQPGANMAAFAGPRRP